MHVMFPGIILLIVFILQIIAILPSSMWSTMRSNSMINGYYTKEASVGLWKGCITNYDGSNQVIQCSNVEDQNSSVLTFNKIFTIASLFLTILAFVLMIVFKNVGNAYFVGAMVFSGVLSLVSIIAWSVSDLSPAGSSRGTGWVTELISGIMLILFVIIFQFFRKEITF